MQDNTSVTSSAVDARSSTAVPEWRRPRNTIMTQRCTKGFILRNSLLTPASRKRSGAGRVSRRHCPSYYFYLEVYRVALPFLIPYTSIFIFTLSSSYTMCTDLSISTIHAYLRSVVYMHASHMQHIQVTPTSTVRMQTIAQII